MLAFVVEDDNPLHLAKTISCLEASPFEVIPLKREIAWRMRTRLANEQEPFFLVFRAGDQIHFPFFQELNRWIARLPENCAGLWSRTTTGPHHPWLWRTQAIHSLPLFRTDHFPFDHYALLDLQVRLSSDWTWQELLSEHYLPNRNRPPKWMNRDQEWQLIQPFLYTRPPRARIKSRPIVSIVICTYNDGDYLSWAIRSAQAQTSPDWELIVVNDGSTDQTQEVLASYQEEPRLTVIENEENRGKAKCLNQALKLAKGEWLLELDADDWLTVDCVAQMVTYADEHPDAALFYGNAHEWWERSDQTLIYRGVRTNPPAIADEEWLSAGFPIAPRCYNRSVLAQMGGWLCHDPFGGRLYEDVQMLLRLQQQKAMYIPLALYHRRIRKNSISHRNLNKYHRWIDWVKQKGWPYAEQ